MPHLRQESPPFKSRLSTKISI